jgi:hypothetical protein
VINSLNNIPKFCKRLQCQVGREDEFQTTNGNGNLHEISNDNGDR